MPCIGSVYVKGSLSSGNLKQLRLEGRMHSALSMYHVLVCHEERDVKTFLNGTWPEAAKKVA